MFLLFHVVNLNRMCCFVSFSALPWGYVGSLPRSLQTLVTQSGVDRKSLSIIDTISRGECGSVVSGQLNNIRTDVMSGSQSVIIKMLTGFPEGSRRDEVVRFLEASTLMKGIKHQNILSVLRVSVEDNHVPLVVYPMVEHCDMYRVIKLASDPEHSVLPPLTVVLTLELAIQIATAMNYLGEHSIVHPDLALRNCVLDSGCVVKISDGALAQQFHPECYYTLFGATRPVRWAAVETLQEGLCTVRSNVWSYAVTVWEILTFAEMPYSEVNNNRSILSTIKMGARLPRPNTCSEELYTLLCTCWNERGEERPSFKTIIGHLKHLLSQLSNEHPDGVEELYVRKRSSSNGIGKSVSRDRLSHGGESPRSRNHIPVREASMGSLKRVSMASMMSRGSTAEKLSVTFSILSGADASGSDSEDEANQSRGLELQNFTDQHEMQSILRQVSTSFIDSPVEKVRPRVEVKDEANSSVHTTTLSDISSRTLVPPPLESPVRSPKLCIAGDETSLASSNPVSLTPPPSQTVDSQSKTSTTDLESVSTAPYTSSPQHGTAFLYPSTFGSGFGVMSNSERGDQSPLVVGRRAHSHTSHSPALLPSQPSAKSTDSGIRSDEDSEATHSPNTSMQYAPKATNSRNAGATSDGGLADFSSSLFAAFDTWGNT
ncbi:Tyrosine-protein kinase transforming protein SEA [Geodia barretti]|uniref:Tyrosine-protein kinase transforming protein SEA n=1 Tax=Geodia barretti TaxID=519541 RepID=A0AA35RC05_GEOBA|nr:Tyrosine-protein kinase transforming protein SEA [Geodia barretti]